MHELFTAREGALSSHSTGGRVYPSTGLNMIAKIKKNRTSTGNQTLIVQMFY
jgi:hypothetical protein